MRRILATAATVALSVLVVPAAHASNPDRIFGGCFFDTAPQVGSDLNVGVTGDLSTTRTGDLPPAPIGATVSCWIEVNGVEAPGTRHTYGDGSLAVQYGVDPLTFTAGPADWVMQCGSVTFADGTTLSGCPLPSDQIIDIERGSGLFYEALNDFFTLVFDPVACPVLVQMAGSYPGGLTIAPDGDVYLPDPLGLRLNPIYDCPPYIPWP
ncbi:MAG: hypothetical protein QOC82_3164 [Frankiaceae bacterium]|jgi:hypothetical protein|nr:hypothetical protein [Frankiaceae bacterium]